MILSRRGHSLVMWAAVFGIVVAAMIIVRPALERSLKGKVMSVTKYMLWQNEPYKYRGDKTTVSRTVSEQDQITQVYEHDGEIELYSGSPTENGAIIEEDTISKTAEEGSQSILPTIGEIEP